jgi:hypothetical protein
VGVGDKRYVPQSDLIKASLGAASADKVPQLNALGKIDGSMITLPAVMVLKGSVLPTSTAPAGPTVGDVWVVSATGALDASWGIAGNPTLAVGDTILRETTTSWIVLQTTVDLALKVSKAGDTMTGPLVLPAGVPTGNQAVSRTAGDALYVNESDVLSSVGDRDVTVAMGGGLVPKVNDVVTVTKAGTPHASWAGLPGPVHVADQFMFNGTAWVAVDPLKIPDVAIGDERYMRSQFLQAGTGAAARTVQSKLRDTVSVKDFGAVGDGVADDTAAIQAALDSVVKDSGAFDLQFDSRGGTVNIPAGRYLVSSTLTINPGTCLIGDGPNISVIVNSGTTNNVLYATDTQGGSVDPLLIENLAVVQKVGVTHTAGNAIHIDAATYGISPAILNVRTQDTHGGVYLDWCYPSKLENVQAMRHTAFGFRARRNCTSTLFQNCYAGAITTGSGFLLAGNYMSLVGCASDNNPSGYGYEFDFDGALTTGVSMLGCGTEGCNGGVYADRVAGLSIVSPRLIVKSGGTHGVQLMGTTSATIVAPVITCLAANANYAIYQASSGGISASATTLIATPSLFSNYTNAFNDTDNVWSFGRQSLYGALWNDRFRLGDSTHDAAGISRFHFGGDFPAGSGGVAYGENFRIEATAAYTVAASVNYQPVVNAPALTLARLIAGPIVTTPTITAGTVTRLEGARFSDIAGGGANVNLALGNGAIPSGLNYSICNTSTRENLQAGPTRWGSSTGPLDTFGTGSPESVVAAPVGSTYRRTDGGAGISFYVKESGTGKTGWVAK